MDDSSESDEEKVALLEIPAIIDFGYQASKVEFIKDFVIKNTGTKKVSWRLSSNKAFRMSPKHGTLNIGEDVQVSIIGLLKDPKEYKARIRVYYDDNKKEDEIPMKVTIINGFFLSRNKLTVDGSLEDNEIKIHNYNQLDVTYELVEKTEEEDKHEHKH